MLSRREFLKTLVAIKAAILSNTVFSSKSYAGSAGSNLKNELAGKNIGIPRLGISKDGLSDVYNVSGGSPKENMMALIERLGGIEKIIGKKDIVVLKPNAQWWMQGMTNTDAMKAYMELVLKIKGFDEEIIIAENHQYNDFNGRGWSTDKPNGEFNYNQLIKYFNKNGYQNVTSYIWRCAGPNPEPIEGDDDGSGGIRVSGPSDGDGYVWRDDIVYESPEGRQCWMTYPVFTSSYSGVTIDLMNGAWKNGNYLKDRNVKFINFSAINHHSDYCGVTASVKNLMGVVDMSCGFQAATPENTYNVHFIGVEKYIRHIPKIPTRYLKNVRRYFTLNAYENFHYTGGALGKFMHAIRLPDLNIITAHWVGWGSRWDAAKSSYPKALLASTDPVALDLIAAKYVLLPETPLNEKSILELNNPDISDGPLFKFLRACHEQGIGNLSEGKIRKVNVVV